MSSSLKSDLVAAATIVSVRMRPGHVAGRDPETFYVQVRTADGKRRILAGGDGLGTLRPVAGGWQVDVPGFGTQVFADRDVAIGEARAFLGDYSEDPA